MNENLDTSFISGPVPGMSLATEPGDRPWEQPSQYSTVEDAIEYYTKRILKDTDSHESIIEILEAGIPVENAAAILNKTSVMDGIHNLDVGFLVLPVIEELVMTVADIYNVKYITSFDDVAGAMSISPREAKMIVSDLDKAAPEATEEEPMPAAPKGLMAKTTTVTGE
jgi:hypothetical protein